MKLTTALLASLALSEAAPLHRQLDAQPIDRSIITCTDNDYRVGHATVCSSPVAKTSCVALHQEVVKPCLSLKAKTPGQYATYDPMSCPSVGPAKVGCNAGGIKSCRYCGYKEGDLEYTSCSGDTTDSELGKLKELRKLEELRELKKKGITLDDVLGLPVAVDCAKFYDDLKLIQEAGCTLDAPSFDPFIANPATAPNPKCPPRLHQLYMSYGADKRFGTQTATNSKGVSFPNAQCSKHLGREMGFGVAGELATIEITAKTMAMRMLKPATFRADQGILNCCEVVEDHFDCTPCANVSTNSIGNPRTKTLQPGAALTPPLTYEYQVPAAMQPQLSSYQGQRTSRVMKGMHGKGQTCLGAKFSFGPLRELYDANKQESESGFIPYAMRVGLLDPKLAKSGATFDTLVRLSGNKNFTVKDVHDVRVRGFALKLMDAAKHFESDDAACAKGKASNCQLKLADIPAYNQPKDAQHVFGDFDFTAAQEEGHIDLLHVAIGTGKNSVATDHIGAFSTAGPDCTAASCDSAKNPPANIFVAANVDNYYNGFVLGGRPDPRLDELTDTYQNPLEYVYGSASALRLGPGAMKLHWAACPGELTEKKLVQNVYPDPKDDIASGRIPAAWEDPNYQLTNLRETIEKLEAKGAKEFRMCGYIQLQDDACMEDIENPTKRWFTESINVFELSFPLQAVPDYNTFCDNTVFQPYRTIAEHMPLGYVNRVRQAVYQYANQFRLILNNGVTQTEHGDSIGQATCPMGYSHIPKGGRPKYQGQPILSASQKFEVDAGGGPAMPDADIGWYQLAGDSSSGSCRTDSECKLAFGEGSYCKTDLGCMAENKCVCKLPAPSA